MTIDTLQDHPFTLVLSGGGALGIAHLGVLHDMEVKGLKPAELVGTSMGGIIAACMSIGMNEAQIYGQIASFVKVSNWIKFSFSGNAIVDNDRIASIFETLFGMRKIADTQIPLKLITTNLKTGHKRVFTAQDDICIKDAVLATMAIPGVFEEHNIDGEVNFFKTHNVLEMFERSMRLLIYNQSRILLQHTDKEVHLIEPETYPYSTYQFHKFEQIRALGLGLL